MNQRLVYVVSDSGGETAELVVKAAASQFYASPVQIKRVPYVEDKTTLAEVVALAKMNQAIIAFTLVIPEMREFLLAEAAREGVVAYDIIGPLIEK